MLRSFERSPKVQVLGPFGQPARGVELRDKHVNGDPAKYVLMARSVVNVLACLDMATKSDDVLGMAADGNAGHWQPAVPEIMKQVP
jgi:hypothetical protein